MNRAPHQNLFNSPSRQIKMKLSNLFDNPPMEVFSGSRRYIQNGQCTHPITISSTVCQERRFKTDDTFHNPPMSSCSGGARDAFKMNQSINFSQQSEGYCYKYFRLDQRISIVWSLNIFHVSSYYFSCDGILIYFIVKTLKYFFL